MSNRFNPYADEQTSPFDETFVPASAYLKVHGIEVPSKAQCRACGRTVFVVKTSKGFEEPDPRGFAGERHSLTTFEEFPAVPFCWYCVNECGGEGYERCKRIAQAGSFMPREERAS